MKETVSFCDFLQLISSDDSRLPSVLQAISDGSVDIDNEIREFLLENFRAISINQLPDESEDEVLDMSCNLTLLKNDEHFADIFYTFNDKKVVLDNILPGNYSLRLSTGMIIWQDELTEHDLLISKYSKKIRKFRMAADTGQGFVSKDYKLAEDLLCLEVIPGANCGSIRLSEIGASDGK